MNSKTRLIISGSCFVLLFSSWVASVANLNYRHSEQYVLDQEKSIREANSQ